MNIDEITGTIGKESMVGIENDDEGESDTKSDSISKLLGKAGSYGNKIWYVRMTGLNY